MKHASNLGTGKFLIGLGIAALAAFCWNWTSVQAQQPLPLPGTLDAGNGIPLVTKNPGETAAQQLYAGGRAGTFRESDGSHVGRQVGSHAAADEAAGGTVRPGRPPGQGRHDVPRQADSGGRAGETARGRQVVAGIGRHESRGNQGEGTLAQGFPAAAASQSSRRRHGLPQAPASTRSRSRKAAT